LGGDELPLWGGGVVRAAEGADRPPGSSPPVKPEDRWAAAVTHAARVLAEAIGAASIAAVTRSGRTAHLLSRERTRLPVFAFSPDAGVCQRLALWWGVVPVQQPLATDKVLSAESMCNYLVRTGRVQQGYRVVIASVHQDGGGSPPGVLVQIADR